MRDQPKVVGTTGAWLPSAGREPPSARYAVLVDRAVLLDVSVTTSLNEATSTEDVQNVVRSAARALLGADGATFVLREGNQCFYAAEDAMSPLWQGQRFPLTSCISGWAMLNDEAAVIPDITVDPRIPQEAYRPTFVQSLLMTPVGTPPVAAIGVYWSYPHRASDAEAAAIEALAHTAAETLDRVAPEHRAYGDARPRDDHST